MGMQSTADGGPETVLVLGGGGGRGAAQLGILEALAWGGIEPDACVGTSVGALNAAVVASHPFKEAVGMLERIWASPQTDAVFKADKFRIVVNRLLRRPWLRGGEAIRDLVDFSMGMIGVRRFEDLHRPLEIIVTDLSSGEPLVVSRGPLRDPLRASCAIPFMFPPVRLGDRLYVDGGVTDNCSLATAVAMNPGRIIAVDLTAENASPTLHHISEILNRVMSVALHSRVVADFDRFSSRLPVTLICPRMARQLGVAEFGAVRDAARTAMETLLQTILGGDGRLAPGVFYLPLVPEG
jgi:NTE family protein